jgi:hypothetical protein
MGGVVINTLQESHLFLYGVSAVAFNTGNYFDSITRVRECRWPR